MDATGGIFSGRRTMRQGWESFFGMFPDYRIEVEVLVAEGETVALFGWASGTFSGRGGEAVAASFRIPAAWKAVVRDGLVAEWTVCADIEPMLRAAGGGRFPPPNPD